MSDDENTCLVVSTDGKVERAGVPSEPMMVPSRVTIIVGKERFNGFIEDVKMWVKDPHCDRIDLKLLIPEKDDEIRAKLAAGLKDASIGHPEQEPTEMPLDEAIDHAERHRLGMLDSDNGLLEKWLTELRYLRGRVRGLVDKLADTQRKFREFRRTAATSPDFNVHVRVEISQLSKQWMHACEVTEMVFRESGHEILYDAANNMLREAIGGFLVEMQRRPWEP